MKRLLLLLPLYIFTGAKVSAQANCTSPLQVTICPTVTLTNQTNAGMLDDCPASCNITGEDILYELDIATGAKKIYASIANATGSMKLSMMSGACGSGTSSSVTVAAGSSNVTFTVS